MAARHKIFCGHLIAALGGVAVFHLAWREVTHKIADQVMVRADAAGFLATARESPFGAVDWLTRILAVADLAWWGVLVQLALVAAASSVAYLALRRRGSSLAPFAPWLAAALYVLPALSLGDKVWMLPSPHFAQMHLVWFTILAACLFAGWLGAVGFVAIHLALVGAGYLWFCDLPADETLWRAWALPISLGWDARSYGVFVAFALLAGFAFVPRKWTVDRVWLHAIAPAAAVALGFVAMPKRDVRDQLRMERAVYENRFADVLEVAPKKARPERMETAWRILAMFRTDRLDRDLWRYPIVGTHRDTREEEMIMDGPLLLFHYGFVMVARRWIFESAASKKAWQPQYYRLLGEAALVVGEAELAKKNFEELARCPFRGDYARRRLDALSSKVPPQQAFADLVPVADCYRAWCAFTKQPELPGYYDSDRIVERFVYTVYQDLQSCPSEMVKMSLAASLLDGHPEKIRENLPALEQIYRNQKFGPVFLEALK